MFDKFHAGRMTQEELKEFRRIISGMSDEELDAALSDYIADSYDGTDVDDATVAAIKRRIDTSIGRPGHPPLLQMGKHRSRRAAAALHGVRHIPVPPG